MNKETEDAFEELFKILASPCTGSLPAKPHNSAEEASESFARFLKDRNFKEYPIHIHPEGRKAVYCGRDCMPEDGTLTPSARVGVFRMYPGLLEMAGAQLCTPCLNEFAKEEAIGRSDTRPAPRIVPEERPQEQDRSPRGGAS